MISRSWRTWVNRLWHQAGLPGPQRLPLLCCLGAIAGLALAWPVQNLLLRLIAAWAGAWMPIDWLRWRQRRRQSQLDRAMAELLPALAALVQALHHPLPALAELAPRAPKALREPLQLALASCGGGQPLPDALTRMATDLGDHFYLHQMAALVRLHTQHGGDLSGGLDRLAERLQARLELEAEAAVETQGYRYLILAFAAATFVPVLYWAASHSSKWELLRHGPGSWLLTWALFSTLVIDRLPRWLARRI